MRARCDWTEDQVRSLQRRLGVWDKAEHPRLEHETWAALVDELDLISVDSKPEVVENPYSMLVNRLNKHGEFVSWKATPNLSPGTITPRLIVIHYTGTNSDQSALNWLTQKGSNVSCHFMITKTGVVWQMADCNRRCWHAGRSYYAGKGFQTYDVNDCSIGIENTGLGDSWPEAQVLANIQVCQVLTKAYVNIIDIVGHDFVAMPVGRKVDPGKLYPWDRVLKECGLEA